MKSLLTVAFAIACLGASADVYDPPTMALTVHIEIVSGAKICAKAIAVLIARDKMTAAGAREFMMVPGDLAPRIDKCLELIFTDLSSPTNGYRVHQVSAYPGSIQ